MDSKQYIELAKRTESVPQEIKTDPIIFKRIALAFIVAGTLLDMIKKNVFYGKPIDQSKWNTQTAILASVAEVLDRGEYIQLQQPDEVINIDPRIFHAVVGIATEATELMQAISNVENFPLENFDKINLTEEVGDLNWYEAILIDALSADWDQIRERNIEKLRARYPEKFDNDKANNRDLDKEREILETIKVDK